MSISVGGALSSVASESNDKIGQVTYFEDLDFEVAFDFREY